MDTKKVMELLNNIVTNKEKVGEGEQVELSFKDPDSSKVYNVEEIGELVNQMDVEALSNDDKEMLEILHRKLEGDNANENMFSNEEALIAPLSQKINEYNHVVDDQEFDSNLRTLNELKARNQNLAAVNLINLKNYETDSKNNLDYVTVRRPDGKVEALPITDPDYMDRFVQEHANEISNLDGEEFYSTLKNSTESELSFVDINMYNANPDIKSKMNAPRVHDEQILGFEQDEVKRLVEQFIPGTPVEIGIDKSGEIFYRAGDALFKGFDQDGHREVRFVQQPNQIDNYVDNKAISGDVKEQISNEEAKSVEVASQSEGGMKSKENMFFDIQRLANLMQDKETILNGNNPELKAEFLGLIAAGLKDRNQDTVMKHGQKLISEFLNYRHNDYELMKATGNTSTGVPMSMEEINIIEELQNIDKNIDMDQARSVNAREEIEENERQNADYIEEVKNKDKEKEEKEDEDIFGFDEVKDEDEPLEEAPSVDDAENYFNFEEEPSMVENIPSFNEETVSGLTDTGDAPVYRQENVKVRTLGNKKNNNHYGLSALTILIEIVTVALIVMMFLSLDI